MKRFLMVFMFAAVGCITVRAEGTRAGIAGGSRPVVQTDSSTTGEKADPLCGPNSLLVVCQILGVQADLKELSNLSSMDESGTTMLGLHEAATRKGLDAAGMKMDIRELSKLLSPGIAHTKKNHFFVVHGYEEGRFRITDPPKASYYLSEQRLSEMWGGNVLVISRKPPAETEAPNIIFDEYLHNFGSAEQDEEITHVYKFKNVGKEKLVISQVRSTCGCTAALLSDKEVPPGGDGEVKVTFSTGQRRGIQSQNVYVHANDPDEPFVKLTLTGVVKSYMTVSPSRIRLGSIKRGEGAIGRVNIFEGEETFKIVKVEPSSKHLFTESFRTLYGKKAGHEVIVALSPETPVGPVKETIVIHTDNPKKARVEIPVEGEVRGDIEVLPQSFFFGFVGRGEELSRRVTIATSGSQALEIEGVDTDLPDVSLTLSPLQQGKKYELVAKLRPEISEGSIKGLIHVHTNSPDQPTIMIPVYGLVKGEQ